VNLRPLLYQLNIQDRDTGLVRRWPINWAQAEFIDEYHRQWNEDRPVRIIVLKARQLGISTATQAIGFAQAQIIPDQAELTVAHDMDSSEHLLTMTTRYWDTFAYKPLREAKYQSRKHLQWDQWGSSIRVTTAKNTAAGRGKTIRFLHGSEVAFWDEGETLMLSLNQTVPVAPKTGVVLESTANGIGNYFYDLWYAAVEGNVDYVPMFFPWWKHPGYRASHLKHVYKAIKSSTLDEDERLLVRLLGGPTSEWEDRVAWRRWAIRNLANGDVNQFKQEYPATPEEAFVSTGVNIFPIDKLNACYAHETGRTGRLVYDVKEATGVRFIPDVSGPLTLYRNPSTDLDWGRYAIGGDPSGTTRGDYACIQVVNRRDLQQVATWRAKIDPLSYADDLARLGLYFNKALLAPEATGPGYGTIGRLVEMQYPNLYRSTFADKNPGILASQYGWSTTYKSKEWAIGHLLKLLVDRDITLHNGHTYGELRNYVTLTTGGYGPASDKGHDDTVMSLAIAYIAAATAGPLAPYTGPDRQLVLPTSSLASVNALDDAHWDTIIEGLLNQ
jgi:hypothetical protein